MDGDRPQRHRFGRNQKIGVASLAIPFVCATAFVFLGKGTFAEWAGFVQIQVPTVLGLIVGASAYVKGREAR